MLLLWIDFHLAVLGIQLEVLASVVYFDDLLFCQARWETGLAQLSDKFYNLCCKSTPDFCETQNFCDTQGDDCEWMDSEPDFHFCEDPRRALKGLPA